MIKDFIIAAKNAESAKNLGRCTPLATACAAHCVRGIPRPPKTFATFAFFAAKKLFATALITLCSSVASALPLTWRADWPDAKPVETLVHRGTDIELQPTWYINKAPADTTGWTYTTFCQTNAVGPWFGPLPGAFFSHTNDVGAAFYNVMIRAQTPGGAVNYTAFARLRMLDSPGFTPGELPLPVATIDFSKVVAINAPWLLPSATNGFIKVEVDPTVPSWAKAPSAPLPPGYATVSNRAMSALQSYTETDPRFTAWADAQTDADGIVYYSLGSGYAYKLRSSFSAKDLYSADDITTISNDFAAADEALSSRLSLASLAATNYTDSAISAAIANTNPTFSNAVLSVGLGIDTNTVAAINALVEAGDELPIGGAATVGGLLLALAAAVAALKRTKADASALRYAMLAPVALVPENDAATLACTDRAVTNATIASGFSTLNLDFPPEVSGHVRDFYLRIVVAAGESAPALSLPQGITIENAGGAVPVIADGEASAASTTLVWFSETAPGIFTAKSETVKAVV